VDLVHNLDPSLFTPVVAFHEANPYVDQLRGAGVEVHLLGRRSYPASVQPSRLKRLVRRARVVRERIEFVRASGAALIHLNNSPQNGCDDWLPAARWCGLPCITHARGFPWAGTGPVTRFLSRRFDRVITISRCVNEAWLAEGLAVGRTTQIYDGVDIGGLRARLQREPAELRAELGVGAGQALVVMVGHLKAWKGQDVVLAALARMTPEEQDRLRVVFVGGRSDSEDDSYTRRLEEMVAAWHLGRSVTFLGPRRDAPDLMNAADIVVHASTTPEPFGLVVLEGMALGKPVIASRLGGPAEVIRAGTGLLFDPASPGELAGLISRLVADSALRRELGEAGRSIAGEFSIDRNVRAVEAVYRDLLGPPV
jgi:glycosyltransferase involved in cell wall biosynthesis